jgi:hypothetical protein
MTASAIGCALKDRKQMAVLSTADSLLVAVPMIGALVVCFFRLDELVGKPRKKAARGHQLSGLNADGRQVCLDPDGTAQPCAPQRRGRG